jgi:hypothetical protein
MTEKEKRKNRPDSFWFKSVHFSALWLFTTATPFVCVSFWGKSYSTSVQWLLDVGIPVIWLLVTAYFCWFMNKAIGK